MSAGVLMLAAVTLILGVIVIRAYLWPRIHAARERRLRVEMEDALKQIYHAQQQGTPATLDSVSGALGVPRKRTVDLVAAMERARLLRVSGSGIILTPAGQSLALQVIRAHRIWERYLIDEVGTALADVHALAETQEHGLSTHQVDHLDAKLGHPSYDPHGDPIPTAAGDLAHRDAVPLVEWPLGRLGRIVHVEDEPPSVFAQILSEGLVPGIDVEPLEVDEGSGLHLRTSTHECWLPSVVAASIHVGPAPREPEAEPLSSLHPGERAVVLALKSTGLVRRRLMDLGLTPGVAVRAEMTSALGDPVAYMVRGTMIALRREQAAQVLVRREEIPDTAAREEALPR
jgi:DtxR family Mn-dependent transcriptional regulator